MLAIENYIKECSNTQAAIFGYLREIILSFSPNVEEDMSKNTPYYHLNGGGCYINNHNKGTALSFCNAHQLTDPEGVLLPADEQNEKYFFFSSLKDVNADLILSMLHQATGTTETTNATLAYC